MQLRSLALQGFKSFVQRTTLEFEPGITAIVGPNGSGKSNLADAFRWTMGEQSLRTLRGRRTEDVLFAGGRGRPPAGFAEVSLTFDRTSPNGRPALDLPFAEVGIARRAYRSGENEYYLNRDRVRLRDITDVFGQVGLDLDGFAVVGQGTVDSALSLRASDRRALVEQAAGTGYLQARLTDSLTRLDQTRENVGRVADLLAEHGPRLRALERQAKLAGERAEVQREFWKTSVRWYGHRLVAPLQEARAATTRLADAETRVSLAQAAQEKHGVELAAIERAGADLETSLSLVVDALAREREVSNRVLRELTADENRRAALLLRREELSDGAGEWEQSLTAERAAIAEVVRRRDEVTCAAELLQTDIATRERDLAGWSERRLALEARRVAARRRLVDAERAVGAASARVAASEDRLEQLRPAIDHRSSRRQALVAEIETLTRRVDAAQGEVLAARRVKDELAGRVVEAATALERCREQLEQDRADRARCERELRTQESKLDALQQMESSGAGLYPGVRAVLQATSDQRVASLSGVIGIVSRLIEVDARLELALEVGLGSHAQDVVVERWTDAEKAIAYLKASNLGRATFLPLDSLRSGRAAIGPSGPGIVGVAAALATFSDRLAAVVDLLLGQTLIVEDLAVAKSALRQVSGGWQIVTIDGQLARTTGAVTGGAPPSNRGALARVRELRQLTRAVAASQTAHEETLRREQHHTTEVKRAATHVQLRQQEVGRADASLNQLSAELVNLESRRKQLADKATWEDNELKSLLTEIETLERRRTEQSALVAAAQDQRQAADAELGEADTELAHFASATEDQTGLLQSRKAELGQLRRRIADLDGELTRAETTDRSILGRLETIKQQSQAADAELSEVERRLAEAQASLDLAEGRRIKLEQDVAAARQQQVEQRARRGEAIAQRRSIETALDRARDDAATARKDVDRSTGEIQTIQHQLALELGPVEQFDGDARRLVVQLPDGAPAEVTIESIPDAESTRERSMALRSRLRTLPTGPDVQSEYESLRERVETLTTQYADLSRTVTTLTEAIDEIRETIRTRFDATFAEVSGRFARRFADLFGGGSARLLVEADGDAAGVDVFAQPPGKRTQTLATLSGGERALTAAALLFSLIETNPPPFCVLDEVDAALDEANVLRFASCLSELSARTQFVVITHNRRTMEVATSIYGLTLEDRCETRLLSLRLPDRAGSALP